MKGSQILEKFFEKRHQQWKKDCYTVLNPESRPSSLLARTKSFTANKSKNNTTKPITKS